MLPARVSNIPGRLRGIAYCISVCSRRPSLGHLLQSLSRIVHSPDFFGQFARAATRAASLVLRSAAPTFLPSPDAASAPHIPGPMLVTTLQPLAPHSLIAASAARFAVGACQLAALLPVASSQAIAPYSARAGAAVSRIDPNPTRTAVASIARRIKVFSFR